MMQSSSSSIGRLLERMKIVSQMERVPGFSSCLGVTYDHYRRYGQRSDEKTSNNRKVHFDGSKTLTMRLPVPPLTAGCNTKKAQLSTYLAIVDDVTTWALVLADPGRCRAGVSVSLSATWVGQEQEKEKEQAPASSITTNTHDDDDDDDDSDRAEQAVQVIDVKATVKKIGNNLGFVDAEIFSVESDTKNNGQQQAICIASHVKYLPAGIVMDFLQSRYGWNITKMVYSGGENRRRSADARSSLFESFKYEPENDRATFHVSTIHSSLGGPIHGGCQAMLMEMAATEYVARQTAKSEEAYHLSSMNVNYLSRPSPKEVTLQVLDDTVQLSSAGKQAPSCFPVRVQLLCDGNLKSEGLLTFAKKPRETSSLPLPIQQPRAKL